MFPASSRVKLNREVGLKLDPRKRRPPKPEPEPESELELSEESRKLQEHVVSASISEEDPFKTGLAHQRSPGNGTDRSGNGPDGGLEEMCVVTRKAKRNHLHTCAGGEKRRKRSEMKTRVSDSSKNSLSGHDASEGCLRRSVGAAHCVLCGECKYISPQRKNLIKQGPKSSSSRSQPSTTKVQVKRGNGISRKAEKIMMKHQHPKVMLCDVGKKCETCNHSCGYVLPDVLKTKVVLCFKQYMRAGFQIWPSCSEHKKRQSEESALVKNNKNSPSVPAERSICQPQSPTEHQEEATDSQVLPSLAQSFHSIWTEEDSVTCSFLPGEQTDGGCRTSMRVDSRSGSEQVASELHRDKRIELQDDVEGSSSALRENCIVEKPGDQRGDPKETDGPERSADVFSENIEMDPDDPESFTCQRVKVYCRKIRFSCARTYMCWPFSNYKATALHPSTTASSAGSLDPSAMVTSGTGNQNQVASSTNHSKKILPDTPLEKQNDLTGDNRERRRDLSSRLQGADVEMTLLSEGASLSCQSDTVLYSIPPLCEGESGGSTAPTSPFLVHGPGTDRSTSTPSPSALGLSDWVTASSPLSNPSSQGASSRVSDTPRSFLPPRLSENLDSVQLQTRENLCIEDTRLTTLSFSSSVPLNNSDSLDSSSLLQHGKHKNDDFLSERSPPKLRPYYASPIKHKGCCGVMKERHVDMDSSEFRLPPVLSPVTSPLLHFWRRSLSCQSLSSSSEEEEEEEEVMDQSPKPTNPSPGHSMAQVFNSSKDNCEETFEHRTGEMKDVSTNISALIKSTSVQSQSSSNNDEDVGDDNRDKSRDDSDFEDKVEQNNRSSEQDTLELGSGVLTRAHPPHSSDEDDTEERSSLSKTGRENDETESRPAGDCQPAVLDEFTAYEQDILLVDVMQEDPDLFENLPKQSLLKLGPARPAEGPKTKPRTAINMSSRLDGASSELEHRSTPILNHFPGDSPDTEEADSRPWRPQRSTTSTKILNTCPATRKQSRHVQGPSDANNNHVNEVLDSNRSHSIQTVSSYHNTPPLSSTGNGPWIKNLANVADFRPQKSNAYCRQYFSDSPACGFKMCRFQHVPVEGDEKFCVETVIRFTKNPVCLQKAGALFTGYYQNNPPGVYFSMPVLLSLLWALLKAGMVSDVFSVLGVSLTHNIVPDHEFLLALFNFVRENSLMGFVPKLMQLTFKMASVGLELSLDCFDCVKHCPMFQQTLHPDSPVSVSGNSKLFTGAPLPEYLNLAHAVVEIELCAKQEDWKRMGEAFRSMCRCSHHPNQVERVSGRVAIALLSESKDKLVLPFAVFAEAVCQNGVDTSLMKTFIGRIGVSLMLRYHKTHQWIKGRRVVEVMSALKVNYTTVKGLFGNEDGASRCNLITVATELFLLSGSVEGALNTLRENSWFVSSCAWPCNPADLESRTGVLIHLAEKTSHRDTLEVLCNLPGVKEPNDSIDASRYSPLFNAHLQVCLEKQVLPVASDTVDFMLCKNLPVDHSVLQTLMHKLGKQNLWLRAREVFRRSLSSGYYPEVSAPSGLMALTVPCQLREVELALAFEMFMTVNASVILPLPETNTASLIITLKRTQSCESDYISAGSRILSAARIPQPRLVVHYTAVNSSLEQVFKLDVSSACRWLRHNHLWATDVWTH